MTMSHARTLPVLFAALAAASLPTFAANPGFQTVLPGGAPGVAQPAGSMLLEDRVARLERILETQSASDTMLQMQQLQQEIQELRGLVETQQFQLQKLQRAQRDQFMDIDARLNGSQSGGDTGAPSADATAPGSTQPPAPGAAAAATPQLSAPGIDTRGLDLKPTLPPTGSGPGQARAPTPSSPRTVGIPSLPSPETNLGNERDLYRDAFELLKQRKYPEAVQAFNDLLRRFPQGEYTDNARYWLGETYYVQRNYPAALTELDRLVQENPASTKLPGALLKIGYIQYEQESYAQSRATFQQLIAKYPDSTEARLAKSRLDKMSRERR